MIMFSIGKKNNLVIFVQILFLFAFLSPVFSQTKPGFKELRSEHFIISYQKDVDEDIVKDVKLKAESYYRLITNEFNLIRDELWMWDNRAQIYIAKDKDSYLSQFDCQTWSAACVNYKDKIIYTYPSQGDFSATLKHELTHIIFREVVGFSTFPLWIDEGMATYIQHKGSAMESQVINDIKRRIKDDSYLPFSRINKVYQLNNDDPDVELFYVQAHSMVYFLLNLSGKFHFKQFLSRLSQGYRVTDALRNVYMTIEDLEGFERLWKRYYLK
ncbi:MAG: hypothetical protein PHV17_03630 [Candidatus Omnitrophica bacterium]|nr:hypothetical protein [Candidatus Omnitrophota bacterium]